MQMECSLNQVVSAIPLDHTSFLKELLRSVILSNVHRLAVPFVWPQIGYHYSIDPNGGSHIQYSSQPAETVMKNLLGLLFVSMSYSIGLCQITTAPQPAMPQQPVVAQPPTPYGMPISLSDARRALAAAEAEALKEGWPVAIAVVDPSGFLVAFARLDNTQLGSVEVAIEKARTSALYRRATKELEDRLVQGGANLKVLRLPGLPIEGGLPIIVDGKIVGAIGVSGVQSTQDAQVATAGMKAMTPPSK
jgi:glc operon protein GlcG